MIDAALVAEVEAWIALDPDPATAATLRTWLAEENETALRRSFAGFLQFGTAGLRGPVGPGPSCMNRAVVGRTAAGIAAYMKKRGLTTVVIANRLDDFFGKRVRRQNHRGIARVNAGEFDVLQYSPDDDCSFA